MTISAVELEEAFADLMGAVISSVAEGFGLEVSLQLRKPSRPSGPHDGEIPLSPRAVVFAAETNGHARRAWRLRHAPDLERHRADRLTFRRIPEGIADEELATGLKLHHSPVEGAAKGTEDLVAIR